MHEHHICLCIYACVCLCVRVNCDNSVQTMETGEKYAEIHNIKQHTYEECRQANKQAGWWAATGKQINKQGKWVDMKDKAAPHNLVASCMYGGCVCVCVRVIDYAILASTAAIAVAHFTHSNHSTNSNNNNKSIWILAAFVFRFIAACYTRVLGVYVTWMASEVYAFAYVCVYGCVYVCMVRFCIYKWRCYKRNVCLPFSIIH